MHEPDSRAFYYWKSTYRLTPVEHDLLKKANIGKLYVHFFDVDWDDEAAAPGPVAQINFAEQPDKATLYVPVVYITNKTMLKIRQENAPDLAEKIFRQILHLAQGKLEFPEIQIDCDWTEGSRNCYFTLLKSLAELAHKENKMLSATIRLHQVKYAQRTGIPPVDRGMLMFYNMGKITAGSVRNSIYNNVDAKKYTASIEKYPLPLDVVLPTFSWAIHIRDGQVIGVLHRSFIPDLLKNSSFSSGDKQTFRSDVSFFLHGDYFKRGDLFRIERATPDVLTDAAQLAARNCKYQQRSIALFDLDSTTTTMINEKTCETAFDWFK